MFNIYSSYKFKIFFVLLFNAFMYLVYVSFVSDSYHLKMLFAVNLCALMIVMNLLPKKYADMDEREKNEYLAAGNAAFNISSFSLAFVFVLHLLVFPEMTVIEFVLYSGIPSIIGLTIRNQKINW